MKGMIMALYQDLKKEFLDPATKLAFKCIEANANLAQATDPRVDFVKTLESRKTDPYLINQSNAMLCGPAAFIYCFACEWPEEYGCYVLELAIRGEGKLGNLKVSPGKSCLDNAGQPSTGWEIDPVDWVALASLRDSSNLVLGVDRPGASLIASAAGATWPQRLTEWFRETGKFRNVQNCASFNKMALRNSAHENPWLLDEGRPVTRAGDPLKNLLSINSLPASYVCMLIDGDLLQSWDGGGGFVPTHWVVLGDGTSGNCGTRIRVVTGGSYMQHPHTRTAMTCPRSETPGERDAEVNRAAILEGKVDFMVFTWGSLDLNDIYKRDPKHSGGGQPTNYKPIDFFYPAGLKVKDFLKSYFGYVAATV
jgi:hypothetical protein